MNLNARYTLQCFSHLYKNEPAIPATWIAKIWRPSRGRVNSRPRLQTSIPRKAIPYRQNQETTAFRHALLLQIVYQVQRLYQSLSQDKKLCRYGRGNFAPLPFWYSGTTTARSHSNLKRGSGKTWRSSKRECTCPQKNLNAFNTLLWSIEGPVVSALLPGIST